MAYNVLLDIFADSLRFVETAYKDVPDARMAEQPAGMRNHPIWTLTHLCVSLDFTLQLLGQPRVGPEAWDAIAAPETKPVADRSVYPPSTQALEVLRQQHARVTEAVRAAKPGAFDVPSPEFLRSFAPTLDHVLTYMLAAHESYHLAQVQVWRRLSGLVPID